MTNSFEAAKWLVQLLTTGEKGGIEPLLDDVLLLAQVNDLLLAAGDALASLDHFPAPYAERYRRLKLLEANGPEVLSALLDRCDDDDVPMLTIKSFLPFPYADSNIDVVLVDPKKVDACRGILSSLKFVPHRNLADIREPRKEMYYQLEHGRLDRTFPLIHLHRSISWNGVIYLDTARVWQRHQVRDVRGKAMPIPSPEDEFLIAAAHAMFENKFVTLHELIYLSWLTGRGLDWDYITQSAQSCFWLDALKQFLSVACALGKLLGLEMSIEMAVPLEAISLSSVSLPYILPLSKTLGPALSKLGLTFTRGRWAELPRQLFTYSLVDCLWMYRKARRKVCIPLG